MMWLQNLDNAGSEPGGGPVGPLAGTGMMLLWIGRIVTLAVGLWELARHLRPQG
jgi:hypothetical protein